MEVATGGGAHSTSGSTAHRKLTLYKKNYNEIITH